MNECSYFFPLRPLRCLFSSLSFQNCITENHFRQVWPTGHHCLANAPGDVTCFNLPKSLLLHSVCWMLVGADAFPNPSLKKHLSHHVRFPAWLISTHHPSLKKTYVKTVSCTGTQVVEWILPGCLNSWITGCLQTQTAPLLMLRHVFTYTIFLPYLLFIFDQPWDDSDSLLTK